MEWLDIANILAGIGIGLGIPVVLRVLLARWHSAQPLSNDPTTPQAPEVPAPTPAPRHPLAEGRRWLLVGAPGSGKSVAARDIIRDMLELGTRVIVLDPEGAPWPRGSEMIGAPDDWGAISRSLRAIASEAQQRRGLFQAGQRVFQPVAVVIDEAPMVLSQSPEAVEIIADLARRGRKLAISLIIITQPANIGDLGLAGKGRVLDAFTRLDVRREGDQIVLWRGEVRQTEIALTPEHDLQFPLPLQRRGPEGEETDRLLAKVLDAPIEEVVPPQGAEPVPPQRAHLPAPQMEPLLLFPELVPPQQPDTTAESQEPPRHGVRDPEPLRISDDDLIRELLLRHQSANTIAAILGGRRADALERIRRIRAVHSIEAS